MALTTAQRVIAQQLLKTRPAVYDGTRAIVDRFAAEKWYTQVTQCMRHHKVAPQDVTGFCDIAGVPD